ncbi:hypothetical protein ACFFX0_27005 [Citricoccus parietis]|uniref:Uncharacterized protein n=1 Tax=Citricoccus parietis TaxID=592307 RepID=A0ABV5G6T3_9MICC
MCRDPRAAPPPRTPRPASNRADPRVTGPGPPSTRNWRAGGTAPQSGPGAPPAWSPLPGHHRCSGP